MAPYGPPPFRLSFIPLLPGIPLEMPAGVTYVASQQYWKRPFPTYIERIAAVHQPDFWTQSAEAMEMTIEGNQLITQEIAGLARDLWHRLGRTIVGLLSAGRRGLPPV